MRKRGGKKAAIRVPKDAKSFQSVPKASSQAHKESVNRNFDSHTLPPTPFASRTLKCVCALRVAQTLLLITTFLLAKQNADLMLAAIVHQRNARCQR